MFYDYKELIYQLFTSATLSDALGKSLRIDYCLINMSDTYNYRNKKLKLISCPTIFLYNLNNVGLHVHYFLQ